VAPTPGCAANFPANRCSQPLILRPFGRSGQELPVEYHVEPHSINFSVSTAKEGYTEASIWKSRGIPSQSNDFIATVPVPKNRRKSHRKKPTFYVFASCLF
jgi:hypothetical protein